MVALCFPLGSSHAALSHYYFLEFLCGVAQRRLLDTNIAFLGRLPAKIKPLLARFITWMIHPSATEELSFRQSKHDRHGNFDGSRSNGSQMHSGKGKPAMAVNQGLCAMATIILSCHRRGEVRNGLQSPKG